MCTTFFWLYTKSFGGKIWRNLHSVSPGNKFGKNLTGNSLNIFSRTKNSKSDPTNFARQININHLGNETFEKRKFEIFDEMFVFVKFHFPGGLCYITI